MDNKEVSLRADRVPTVVLGELWEALPEGMSKKDAVTYLLRSPGPEPRSRKARETWEQQWRERLQRLIRDGLLRHEEFASEPWSQLSTHIPRATRDVLRLAADSVGLNGIAAAARHILVGLAGEFRNELHARIDSVGESN